MCVAAGFVFAGFEGQSLQTQKVLCVCIGQSRWWFSQKSLILILMLHFIIGIFILYENDLGLCLRVSLVTILWATFFLTLTSSISSGKNLKQKFLWVIISCTILTRSIIVKVRRHISKFNLFCGCSHEQHMLIEWLLIIAYVEFHLQSIFLIRIKTPYIQESRL